MPASPSSATSASLVVAGLSVSYPDRTVLSGVDLLAQPGRRIGLVGENGVGKSTLLRAVAGRLPDRLMKQARAALVASGLPVTDLPDSEFVKGRVSA